MQILFDYSEEDNTECLGLIKGNITKFNKKMLLLFLRWVGIKSNVSLIIL